MLDSKDAILAKKQSKTAKVYVPAWEDFVCLRVMSGAERDAFESSVYDGSRRNLVNLRGRFAAIVLSNADGERLYSDADASELGQLPATALEVIFDEGRKLNGMSDEDVEDLEGKSESDQSGSSGSS